VARSGWVAKAIVCWGACMLLAGAFAGVGRATAPGLNGKIVFSSEAPPFPGANNTFGLFLHTINPDGTAETTLQTACPFAGGLFCENSLYYPTWSPNGSKLGWSNTNFLWTMNADGTGLTSVTNSIDPAFDPPQPALRLPSGEKLVAFSAAWSPDGTRLAIIGNGTTVSQPQIYTVNPDGTGLTVVPNTPVLGYNGWLSWSPDGTKIAFARTESTNHVIGVENAADTYIAVVDLASGSVTDLTSHVGVPANFFVSDQHPDWSPDGSKLVFFRHLSDGFEEQFVPDEIYTMNANGTGLTQVTHSTFPYGPQDPAWSPDCTKLVYEQVEPIDGSSYNQIVVSNTDGSNRHTLTSGAYQNLFPNWQPLPGGPPVTCTTAAPVDANGDGVADTLQPPGTATGAFVDSSLTPPTTGSIVDNGGLTVTISNATDPADGVQVTVGSGSGTAKLSVCSGFTLKLAAGSTAVVTCGSVTVKVAAGSVDIVLGGGVATITVAAGDTAYVKLNADGSYLVKELAGSSPLAVSVDGVTTTIAPGSELKVQAWHFVGFAQPVDNNGVLNVAKAGRVIPLKWRILNAANQPVTNLTVANVSVTTTACASGTPTDALEEYAAGASALQNLGNGNYQFNWQTPSSYASSCRTLSLDIGDGVRHTALFNFTK
jgi:hypothetical protein